jgi:hypothetical protein
MSGASTLLGQNHASPVATPAKSKEEEDQQERNTKKAKDSEQSGRSVATKGGSYKEMVTGVSEERREADLAQEEEDMEGDEVEGEGMKVEEKIIDGYECPEFVFSKTEEKRIFRPWRRGVIVKLLGRRIGYKALETRLKQMWVRKGVISIIDLSNDYYLVVFTNEEDKYAALMDGPWFIYDHYLTVKEWSPNFQPASDTIEEVAVWVRISGLPIEFYDAKILNFIGNRVGKTVKVDKNTLTRERGKYARLCVQVNLTKPLLAAFTIKGRKYNVEYEGLHMLCLTCGKFGHYKDGCPERVRTNNEQQNGTRQGGSNVNQVHGLANETTDGPWRVVQKQRRGKKGVPGRSNVAAEDKNNGGPGRINAGPGKLNAEPKIAGSRFVSLSNDIPDINEEDMEREDGSKGEEQNEGRIMETIDSPTEKAHTTLGKR